MKKTLCLLLSVFLLMTCIPVAYAADEATISIGTVSGYAGDTVTVPIQMAGNPGLVAMRMYVQYDATKLRLVSAEDKGLLGVGNDYFDNDISENPYTLLWEDALTKVDYTNNGTLAELQFAVLENVAPGTASITLTLDAGSTFNVGLTNVSFTLQNGAVQITEKLKYTVFFMVNGSVYKTEQYHEGDLIATPASPSIDGYTFKGWSPSILSTMPARDLTFTAQFAPNTYNAVLMADGKQVAVIPYSYGQKSIDLPTVPAKEGHTGAWPSYELPIGGTTITALYTKNTYTVTWNVEGSVTTSTVTYGHAIEKLADPTKDGYTFKGWTPAVPATMPAKDMTFTAVFEKIPDPVIKIHNYTSSRTVDYRTTITFSVDEIQNPVDGASVHWFINGQDKGASDTYTEKEAKATYTVQAKYMKGNTIIAESEVETVNVKTGFFAKLKAFFRALFGRLPKVVQEYLGVEIIDRVLP